MFKKNPYFARFGCKTSENKAEISLQSEWTKVWKRVPLYHFIPVREKIAIFSSHYLERR